jgi:hypothetical protein
MWLLWYLNPRHKWAHIKRNWEKAKWIKKSEKIMKELWDAYKPQDTDMAPSQTVIEAETSNQFLLFLEEQDAEAEVIEDEYAHYCSQPTIKIKDARNWWLQPTQQQFYPHLSKLALEILSIPAMSAEPERLFSGTKLIVTERRMRLSIKMIQALASLKSWYKLKNWKWDDDDDVDLLVGPKAKDDE